MHVTAANLSPATLRAAETVTLGAALVLFRDYGLTKEQFVAAHPELWRPIIPAAPLREFLISAKVN